MKKHSMLVFFAAALLFYSNCSKGDHGHDSHGSHSGSPVMQPAEVKIVVTGDIQAAFELASKAMHDEMAKEMKISTMDYDKKADTFIVISLLTKDTKTIIKNAAVEVEIVTPDKKTVKSKAHTMEGGGMFHYSAGFQMAAKGVYRVKALITIGSKKANASTELEVK